MDYIDDENVELPCEFCQDLYPWSLLGEHQIVCELNPEVLDFVPFVPAENSVTVEDPKKEPAKMPPLTAATRQTANSIPIIDPKTGRNVFDVTAEDPKKEPAKMPPHTTATLQTAYTIPIIDPRTGRNVFESVNDENTIQKKEPGKPAESVVRTELPKVATKIVKNQQNQGEKFTSQTEEFMTKTGEKLLVYGANMDPVEDLDAEKQSSKITNPLTSNYPKEEDVEDINNLSDDDCEETLEDFWKRARDFLKRNKTKIEC